VNNTRIQGIRPPAGERHVTFNETVEVRCIEQPLETHQMQPSLHAQRVELALRAAPIVTPQQPVRVEIEPATEQERTAFQKVCGVAAAACFAGAFVSIGLIFAIGALAFAVMAGCVVLAMAFESGARLANNDQSYIGP